MMNDSKLVFEELSSGWRQRVLQLTILFSIAGYFLFSIWGGGEAVLRALGRIGVTGAVGAFGLIFLAQCVRFLRWQWNGKQLGLTLPWKKSFLLFFSGFALMTTSTQAKGALRGALLSQEGIPFRKSLGILFAERVTSACGLLVLLGGCLWRLGYAEVGYLGVFLLLFFCTLQKPQIFQFCKRILPSFVLFSAFKNLFRWKVFLPSLIFAVLAFTLEGAALYGILLRLPIHLEWDLALVIFSLATGGAALTMIPAGLGSFELIIWQLFLIHGLPDAPVVATIISFRFVSLWVFVLLGFFAQSRVEG